MDKIQFPPTKNRPKIFTRNFVGIENFRINMTCGLILADRIMFSKFPPLLINCKKI
jgi:hypothetical protein